MSSYRPENWTNRSLEMCRTFLCSLFGSQRAKEIENLSFRDLTCDFSGVASNSELVKIDLGDVCLRWQGYQSKALGPKNLFMTIPDLRNLISRGFQGKNFAHVHVHVHVHVNGLGGRREAQTI